MKLLTILLLAAVSANSQSLPDKPQPRTVNAEFWIETGALATAWTLDTVSTHQAFVSSPYRREAGGLFNGSRSTPKVMGAWAAVDVAAVLTSYEWKRHVHNKWLHPLWRVLLLVGAEQHTQAAIGNWRVK